MFSLSAVQRLVVAGVFGAGVIVGSLLLQPSVAVTKSPSSSSCSASCQLTNLQNQIWDRDQIKLHGSTFRAYEGASPVWIYSFAKPSRALVRKYRLRGPCVTFEYGDQANNTYKAAVCERGKLRSLGKVSN